MEALKGFGITRHTATDFLLFDSGSLSSCNKGRLQFPYQRVAIISLEVDERIVYLIPSTAATWKGKVVIVPR
jgi:hypothetical protein